MAFCLAHRGALGITQGAWFALDFVELIDPPYRLVSGGRGFLLRSSAAL